MNNNDIVRNASVIMNHYERHRRNTVLRGREKKLNAHCKEEKNLFHNQVHTDNPSQKKTMLGPQEQDRLKVTMNKYPRFLSQCSSSKFWGRG